jgi:hypothetical protein
LIVRSPVGDQRDSCDGQDVPRDAGRQEERGDVIESVDLAGLAKPDLLKKDTLDGDADLKRYVPKLPAVVEK